MRGIAVGITGARTTLQSRTLDNAVAGYDSSAVPVRFVTGPTNGSLTGTQADTFYSSGSAAAGDLLMLGAWNGAQWQTGGTTTVETRLAYVAGIPVTPQIALATQRASYTLSAATPVYTDRDTVGRVASAALTIDFLAGTRNSLGALSVLVDLPAGTGSGTTRYSLSGSLTGNGASLDGSLSVGGSACSSGADSCSTGSASGFFANAASSKVGLSYQGATSAAGAFGGTLAFGQSGSRSALTVASGNGAASYVVSLAYLGNLVVPSQRTLSTEGDQLSFYGTELIEAKPRGSQPNFAKIGTTTAASASAGGIGIPGSTDFIGWGRWEQGTVAGTFGVPLISNAHYIVATPTTNASMPTSGLASYNLVGGTEPVSSTRGTGTLEGGSLTANFATGALGARLNLGFGGTVYSVGGTGRFAQGATAAVISSTGGSNGAPITAAIDGVFSGPNAYRAGITYSVTGSAPLGYVNGAAVFQKAP